MTHSAGLVTPFIKSEAEVIKSAAVHKKTLALGSENSYELWCEVQNLPKLHFLFFKFLFGLLAVVYVR